MAIIAVAVTLFVIFQIYIISKVLLKVNPNIKQRHFYKWIKRVSYCLPVFVLIVGSIILYFVKIIHLHFVSWKEWNPYIHSIFAIYLWTNVVFNYLAAAVSKPGRPPRKGEILLENNLLYPTTITTLTEIINSKDLISQLCFCEKCERLSTYGTQHCNKCNTCFRMLCHHSYIVNNCIGLANFVYYFSFLVYGFIGLSYSLLMLYGPFYACYIHDHNFSKVSLKYPALSQQICHGLGEIPLLFIIVAVAFVLHVALLLLHCLLLAADLSYNTFMKNLKVSSDKLNTLKSLFKKTFHRHRRMKFNLLLRVRKESWVKFLYPSFVTLPDDLCVDDLFDEEKHFVQIV